MDSTEIILKRAKKKYPNIQIEIETGQYRDFVIIENTYKVELDYWFPGSHFYNGDGLVELYIDKITEIIENCIY